MENTGEHADKSLSLSKVVGIDQLCDQYERALHAAIQNGRPWPSIEDYLGDTTEPVRSQLRKELLAVEASYRQRQTGGGNPDPPSGSSLETRPWQPEEPESRPTSEDATFNQPQLAREGNIGHPDCIGRFRIERVLGRGAFGTVYLAFDSDLKRNVAIKVPHRELIDNPESMELYLEEAQVVACLDHPAIVPVYDFGQSEDGLCYVVSKYIEGGNLASRMAARPLSHRESAEVVATLAEALHHSHNHLVIHRDIKPANILIDSKGKPYLADFGMALKENDFAREGGLVGTPAYMSPEQANGEGHLVDGRSDIFSLGVVLYQLLTSTLPFRGRSKSELIERIKTLEAYPPRQLDDSIPKKLERICLKAIAKRVEDRYMAAIDFAKDLRRFLERDKPPSRRTGPTPPHGPNWKAWDFAPLVQEKRRGFCGREWLFEAIERWRLLGNERMLLITGDPGAGKSAILAQFLHLNPEQRVVAYHFCQADTLATLEPWRFVRSLAAMFAGKFDEYAVQCQDPAVREALSETRCKEDPASALEEGLLGPLQKISTPPNGPLYLLIDALDEAMLAKGPGNMVDLLATRLSRLPSWLRIVATTRKQAAVLARLKGLSAKELDAQSAENLADVRDFIVTRLNSPDLAKKLAESRLNGAEVVRMLCEKSQGNFLYVEQTLDGIERGLHAISKLDSLPPGLEGLYMQRFDAQFPDAERFAACRRVLDVIVAAREPLAKDELARAAGMDAEKELLAALKQLSAYVPARSGGDGVSRYATYHKSLVDWLTDPERRDEPHSANPKRGHQRLADAFWQDYQNGVGARSHLLGHGDQAGKPDERAMSPYALAHLPTHLTAAGRWDDVERLLCDIFYLEAKVKAGKVFDLAADFTMAIDALSEDRPQRRILRLLEEALRRDIHFIARHAQDYPQCLFQCLWNSCWWYDCADAAKHYIESEGGWSEKNAPWLQRADRKLCQVLEQWLDLKQQADAGFPWLRSHRPPSVHLGTAQLAVLRGHERKVTSVAFSAGGDRIVSGSQDETLRVWDARSGAELAVLRGHEGLVHSVAFSPNGDRIVSGSWDDTVRVWDAHSGAELAVLRGHEGEVSGVAFSPNGDRIVSGSWDDTVRVWDAHSGAELAVLRGHEKDVNSVAFSHGGDRIVSGSQDETVRIWDARSGAELTVLRGHEGPVMSVAFSPGEDELVSGSDDNTVRVWDAGNGAELAVLYGHGGIVHCVAFSPGGDRIVSGSQDETVRVWDARSGANLAVLRGHESLVHSVAFSPDGNWIVSAGGWDRTIRVWDARNSTELAVLRGHEDEVSGVAFSPGGDRIVSGGGRGDNTVRVWDARTGAELAVVRGHKTSVDSMAFSPGGDWIASGSWDNTVWIWDAGSGAELAVLRGHEGPVMSVAFSPDGNRIASGSADYSVRVWDARSGAELAVLRGHEDLVVSVAFSPDGDRIVSGSLDDTARVWNAHTGEELAVLRGHEAWVTIVAFSPDGDRIVSGSGSSDKDGCTLRVWDTRSGAELTVLRGHGEWVNSVAFSPDGNRIVSGGGWDKTVRVWDARNGHCLEVIRGSVDVHATAAGSRAFPLRALVRGLESVVERADSGQLLAWFPVSLSKIVTHPSARTWAGAAVNYVCLITLEGGDALPAGNQLQPPLATREAKNGPAGSS